MPGTKLTTPREKTDPRYMRVQICFRVPYWYREQMIDEANHYDTTVPQLILSILEDAIPPAPPL